MKQNGWLTDKAWLALWVFGLSLVSGTVKAASNSLLDFSASMRSFSANFTQTVYDSDSVILQESSGQVVLMRPGRFRWTYDEPIRQVIVADGLTLWVYDEDIKQVTMQPQSTTLGSAPIGLLSGKLAIESEFKVTELGIKDGLQWFQLEPLVQDTDFQSVFIALDDNGLIAMELRDNFDQATQIRFQNFRKNARIEDRLLRFEPPSGADVVGEAGVASETVPQAQNQSLPATEDESTQSRPSANETSGATALPSATDNIDPLLSQQPDQQQSEQSVEPLNQEPPVVAEQQPDAEVQFREVSVTRRPLPGRAANATDKMVSDESVDEVPANSDPALPADPLLAE